jgi:hypothetical protein
MISAGNLVTPMIDQGIGTNRDRWIGIVTDVHDDRAYVESVRWYDAYGNSHDHPNLTCNANALLKVSERDWKC